MVEAGYVDAPVWYYASVYIGDSALFFCPGFNVLTPVYHPGDEGVFWHLYVVDYVVVG